MVTNKPEYMKEYMRKVRKPYKRQRIMKKLMEMGFMENSYPIDAWYFKNMIFQRPET